MVLMHRGEEEGELEEEEEEEEEEMESIERSYLELLGAGEGGGDFVMLSKEEEVVVEEGFLFSPPYSSSSSNYSSSTCCFPQMLNFGGSTDHDHGFLMPSDQRSLSTLSPPPPPPPPVTSSKSKARSSRRVSASRRATTTTTDDCSTKNATNKKPKAQGTTKVRKEKIGDRINALQQLVSPFGKTDTATVLHEALGYIRFLHDQVQVLSSPYMQSISPASSDHQESEEKMKVGSSRSHKGDLRSRGLCLVPVSSTETVADKNGADMWSPAPCSSGPKH